MATERRAAARLAVLSGQATAAREGTGATPPSLKVALTLDDLPVWPHWRSSVGRAPASIAEAVTAAIARHCPGAYCFANSGTGAGVGDCAEYVGFLDKWVAAGNFIGNHTHSHVSIGRTTADAYSQDVERADSALSPWLQKTPQKYFRFATDNWGETDEDAEALAKCLHRLGYVSAPASSFVFEWKWDLAYLGALGRGDVEEAAWLREEFVKYSVAQTLYDAQMSKRLRGRPIVPIALLHTLTIVADTIEAWLSALEAAGVEWVPLAEAMADGFYTDATLTEKADKTKVAVTYFRKAAAAAGLEYPEIVPSHQELMRRVGQLARTAVKDGYVEMMETQFAT